MYAPKPESATMAVRYAETPQTPAGEARISVAMMGAKAPPKIAPNW